MFASHLRSLVKIVPSSFISIITSMFSSSSISRVVNILFLEKLKIMLLVFSLSKIIFFFFVYMFIDLRFLWDIRFCLSCIHCELECQREHESKCHRMIFKLWVELLFFWGGVTFFWSSGHIFLQLCYCTHIITNLLYYYILEYLDAIVCCLFISITINIQFFLKEMLNVNKTWSF